VKSSVDSAEGIAGREGSPSFLHSFPGCPLVSWPSAWAYRGRKARVFILKELVLSRGTHINTHDSQVRPVQWSLLSGIGQGTGCPGLTHY
jgi:hypothetical protein